MLNVLLILLGTLLLKVAYVPRLAAVGSAGRPYIGLFGYALAVDSVATVLLTTGFGVRLWLMRRAFMAGKARS